MNRIVFILSYVFFAAFFSGLFSPRAFSSSILLGFTTRGAHALLNPYLLLFISGPFMLTAIAYFRGTKINRPWLALFPSSGMVVGFGPSLIEALYLTYNPNLNVSNALIILTKSFNLISFLVPLTLHILCIATGFKQPAGKPND